MDSNAACWDARKLTPFHLLHREGEGITFRLMSWSESCQEPLPVYSRSCT